MDVHQNRLSICHSCDRLSDGRCMECFCIVAMKVTDDTATCPLGKW